MSKYDWSNIELVERNEPRQRVGASLFILIAGAIAMVFFLVFLILRITAPPKQQGEPVLSELIPVGTKLNENVEAEISWVNTTDRASTQYGYVFSYSDADRTYIGLVAWNDKESRYTIISSVPLIAGEISAGKVIQLAKEQMSSYYPNVLLVVSELDHEQTELGNAVFVATVDNGILRLLRMVTKSGDTRTAMFLRDDVGGDQHVFRIEDIDSDGVKEVISDDVYKFKNNIFVYDQDLSVAMTLRDKLFPSPGGAAR